MPMTPEEVDGLAGEYVLGTLPADERAAFERAMARDPALRDVVAGWETRLSPLAFSAPNATPSTQLWRAVEESIGPPDNVVQLRRRVTRWRMATGFAGAMAASLAAALWLKPPAPTTGGRYVAVVNRSGDLPALIVRVDTGTGAVFVRSVATETPTGRDLELWYIRQGDAPKSLGVVKADGPERPLPATLRGGVQAPITMAVTVEPQGGSPTGGPTGPVVYSGTLIPE